MHNAKKNVQKSGWFNSLTTIGYLQVFYAIDTFHISILLELAMETWVKASLTFSLWVHDLNHTHSLASFQWWGPFDQQWMLHMNEHYLQIQKWLPYKGRGMVSAPICAKKVRNQPRLFYSQPRQLPLARHIMTIPTLSHLFCYCKTDLQNRVHHAADNKQPKLTLTTDEPHDRSSQFSSPHPGPLFAVV